MARQFHSGRSDLESIVDEHPAVAGSEVDREITPVSVVITVDREHSRRPGDHDLCGDGVSR